jgi:hypothetical protein
MKTVRTNTVRTLFTITAAATALLLWGCGEESEVTDEGIRGEMGQAVEETREGARDVMGEGREALEETGDRVESATD